MVTGGKAVQQSLWAQLCEAQIVLLAIAVVPEGQLNELQVGLGRQQSVCWQLCEAQTVLAFLAVYPEGQGRLPQVGLATKGRIRTPAHTMVSAV
jgi:hypothetical protein